MKSRLAKKLCRTPWNKLAPQWLNALFGGGNPPTFDKALRMYHKLDNKAI